MAKSKTDTLKKDKPIKLVWGSLSETPTIYANQLLISHSGGEFYLVFGEFLAAEVDIENPPDSAKIKPIIKVAVNPFAMLRMAEVISDNVKSFRDKIEKGQIESDGTA